MNRQDKEQTVAELKDTFDGVISVVLTDYRGLDVSSMVELRAKLREASVGYRVVKNSLAKLALDGTDKAFLQDYLDGPVAIAWSDEDPVAPAKLLTEFAKDHEALELKIGYLSGDELDQKGLKALAALPSKDELRSQFLSVLNGPAQQHVSLLAQVPRTFLMVLKQRELQGGAEASAEEASSDAG